MKIQGQYTFEAPRQVVWDAVMNPEIIAKIMPGCDALEEVGENSFQGAMKIKVGPVQGKFKGTVELSELNAPQSYRLKMKGTGAPGFVEAEGLLELAEDGETTVLSYEIDAKIGGRMASVGQRLLESSTKVIARQSLEGLDAQVQAIVNPAGVDEAPAQGETAQAASETKTASKTKAPASSGPPPPSQAEFAARFARGMLEEMVPPKRLPHALGLAALLGFLVGFLCGRLGR